MDGDKWQPVPLPLPRHLSLSLPLHLLLPLPYTAAAAHSALPLCSHRVVAPVLSFVQLKNAFLKRLKNYSKVSEAAVLAVAFWALLSVCHLAHFVTASLYCHSLFLFLFLLFLLLLVIGAACCELWMHFEWAKINLHLCFCICFCSWICQVALFDGVIIHAEFAAAVIADLCHGEEGPRKT